MSENYSERHREEADVRGIRGLSRMSTEASEAEDLELQPELIEPTASTSALSLLDSTGDSSSNVLRERTRSPYVAATPSKEDLRGPSTVAAEKIVAESNTAGSGLPSSKGKERSFDNEEKDKEKEALFACHIWCPAHIL